MDALVNFRPARDGLQAFGVYVVYLFVAFVIAAVIGYFLGLAFVTHSFQVAAGAFEAVSALASFGLAVAVLSQKGRLGGWIWLAVLAGVLGGGTPFLGMIIPAVLTRLQPVLAPVEPSRRATAA